MNLKLLGLVGVTLSLTACGKVGLTTGDLAAAADDAGEAHMLAGLWTEEGGGCDEISAEHQPTVTLPDETTVAIVSNRNTFYVTSEGVKVNNYLVYTQAACAGTVYYVTDFNALTVSENPEDAVPDIEQLTFLDVEDLDDNLAVVGFPGDNDTIIWGLAILHEDGNVYIHQMFAEFTEESTAEEIEEAMATAIGDPDINEYTWWAPVEQ